MLVSSAGRSWPVFQHGAETMSMASQIQTFDQERNTVGKLIVALRQTAEAIDASIEAEEGRTRLRDLRDPSYSLVARSLRARRENLRVTISMLEHKMTS